MLCSLFRLYSFIKITRLFLLGHCSLYFDNIDQSIDLFLKASYNLTKDQYLIKFMKLEDKISLDKFKTGDILNATNEPSVSRRSILINKKPKLSELNDTTESFKETTSGNTQTFSSLTNENLLLLEYYTKVIHYLELNGNLLAAIELIQSALLKCQFDINSKSKLYCILFKTYMELEYFEKAHMALMSNLDTEWKKTCLKHFITELCNQNKTEMLINFDYGDMLLDVLHIVYSRAQSTDLHNNVYYRVLYSIYIKINDYRNAAFCMYEYATRLRREMNGINFLIKQEKCYLACLNALKLVDKKFAWIHVLQQLTINTAKDDDLVSKKTINSKFQEFHLLHINNTIVPAEKNENNELGNRNLNFQIIDMDEINRNYMIVNFMIKVSTIIQNQSSIGNKFLLNMHFAPAFIKLNIF